MERTALELLDSIDDPEHPLLGRLLTDAMEETESKLAEMDLQDFTEGTIRRLSYTYYYDWEADDPDYILLVQDPGPLQKRHVEELRSENPLADGCSKRDQVQVYRQFGKSWLAGRNSDFSKNFFGALEEYGLVDVGTGWKEYLESERMYTDFYLGDVVKYRADGFGTSAEDVSYEHFLKKEITTLDPEIIFTFGGNAWSALRRNMDPQPLTDDHVDASRIMDIHGVPHEIKTPVETTILPLSHMSGQVWWRYPPDDYIAELQWGLSMFEELA